MPLTASNTLRSWIGLTHLQVTPRCPEEANENILWDKNPFPQSSRDSHILWSKESGQYTMKCLNARGKQKTARMQSIREMGEPRREISGGEWRWSISYDLHRIVSGFRETKHSHKSLNTENVTNPKTHFFWLGRKKDKMKFRIWGSQKRETETDIIPRQQNSLTEWNIIQH